MAARETPMVLGPCVRWRASLNREPFEAILESEEEHADFLETQLGLIPRIGIENDIQLQSEAAE